MSMESFMFISQGEALIKQFSQSLVESFVQFGNTVYQQKICPVGSSVLVVHWANQSFTSNISVHLVIETLFISIPYPIPKQRSFHFGKKCFLSKQTQQICWARSQISFASPPSLRLTTWMTWNYWSCSSKSSC